MNDPLRSSMAVCSHTARGMPGGARGRETEHSRAFHSAFARASTHRQPLEDTAQGSAAENSLLPLFKDP
eukprot:6174299-Pleurochrysis_carterae.AAC.3